MKAIAKQTLNFDTLEKGDRIESKDVEKITGTRYGTVQFQFAAMKLAQDIMKARPGIVTRINHGVIIVMTDAEASEYCHARWDAHREGMMISHHRACGIERDNLDDSQRRTHDAMITYRAAVNAAMIAETKKQSYLAANAMGIIG